MGKQSLAIVFCAIALLILVVSFGRNCGTGGSADAASDAEWICMDCGHVYTFTQKALDAHYRDHYGEPLSCPDCDGLKVNPATRCPHCDKPFGRPARGNLCPHCSEALSTAP